MVDICCLFNGFILSLPLLICLILKIISLFVIKGYNDGVFKDFYNNWEKKPIISIKIESNGEKLSLGKSLENEDLFIWKGKQFYVERGQSDYFEAFDDKNILDLNLCGTDSNGNHLYFEKCPINYIEFSSNSNPYISKQQYKVQTIQIDSSTYLHYSNEFINGKILIDLHVSDFYGPCSNIDKKDICSFYDNCNDKCSSKESIIDISYFNLDYEEFSKFADDNNLEKKTRDADNLDFIYLYGRTYIGSNNVNDFNKADDYNKIKNQKSKIMEIRKLTFIILILILVCLIIILIKGTYKFNIINVCPFLIGILSIILQIFCIFLEFKIREYEKNIQGKYLKYIYHQVSEDYSKNKVFMKINYSLLFFYFLNCLFLIIVIFNYENNPKSYFGLRNITDESNVKIDNEDQFNWCTSEKCCFCHKIEEIEELENKLEKFYTQILRRAKNNVQAILTHQRLGPLLRNLKQKGIIDLFNEISRNNNGEIDFNKLIKNVNKIIN